MHGRFLRVAWLVDMATEVGYFVQRLVAQKMRFQCSRQASGAAMDRFFPPSSDRAVHDRALVKKEWMHDGGGEEVGQGSSRERMALSRSWRRNTDGSSYIQAWRLMSTRMTSRQKVRSHFGSGQSLLLRLLRRAPRWLRRALRPLLPVSAS